MDVKDSVNLAHGIGSYQGITCMTGVSGNHIMTGLDHHQNTTNNHHEICYEKTNCLF